MDSTQLIGIQTSEGIGEFINSQILIECHGDLEKILSKVVIELESGFAGNNLSSISTELGGCYVDGQIIIANNTEEVRIHEAMHKELYEAWPECDISFNEGWAYASADFLCADNEIVKKRYVLSTKLKSFYETVYARLSNGGLTIKEIEEMRRLTGRPEEEFGGNAWLSFLRLSNNFQHYAMFYDLLANCGYEESKKIVFDAAVISSQSGELADAMKYITDVLDSKGLTDYPINSIPIWDPDNLLIDGMAAVAHTKHGNFKIGIWTYNNAVVSTVYSVLKRNEIEIEASTGTIRLGFDERFEPHIKSAIHK